MDYWKQLAIEKLTYLLSAIVGGVQDPNLFSTELRKIADEIDSFQED